jgi:hypothetical protein
VLCNTPVFSTTPNYADTFQALREIAINAQVQAAAAAAAYANRAKEMTATERDEYAAHKRHKW